MSLIRLSMCASRRSLSQISWLSYLGFSKSNSRETKSNDIFLLNLISFHLFEKKILPNIICRVQLDKYFVHCFIFLRKFITITTFSVSGTIKSDSWLNAVNTFCYYYLLLSPPHYNYVDRLTNLPTDRQTMWTPIGNYPIEGLKKMKPQNQSMNDFSRRKIHGLTDSEALKLWKGWQGRLFSLVFGTTESQRTGSSIFVQLLCFLQLGSCLAAPMFVITLSWK